MNVLPDIAQSAPERSSSTAPSMPKPVLGGLSVESAPIYEYAIKVTDNSQVARTGTFDLKHTAQTISASRLTGDFTAIESQHRCNLWQYFAELNSCTVRNANWTEVGVLNELLQESDQSALKILSKMAS